MELDYKQIGRRIARRRKKLGLTQAETEERADIGAGYYGQIEMGTSQMSIDTLIKLSHSMHLPMEYILFGTNWEPGDPSDVLYLLKDCTARELELAKDVLRLFLMKND